MQSQGYDQKWLPFHFSKSCLTKKNIPGGQVTLHICRHPEESKCPALLVEWLSVYKLPYYEKRTNIGGFITD